MSIGVLDLLGLRGFVAAPGAKMVRHKDVRFPVRELLRHGWLETYQCYQSRPIFHRASQVLSFYGLDGNRACFFGIFEKKGLRPAAEGDAPPDCGWAAAWRRTSTHFYELERVRGFEEFEDRVVIDWGPAARNWHQPVSNKAVAELTPKGRRLPPFDDYLEFSLTYDELRDLFANPDAHHEWRSRLQAVAGVYLVLAARTGDLYVGSASGDGGIWARWRDYARTGDGGNTSLKRLISKDSQYPKEFRFSILQVMSKTRSRAEVVKREVLYKEKLGSRARGLNSN